MKKILFSLAVIMTMTLSGYAVADKHATKSADYMPSLITTTPLEG